MTRVTRLSVVFSKKLLAVAIYPYVTLPLCDCFLPIQVPITYTSPALELLLTAQTYIRQQLILFRFSHTIVTTINAISSRSVTLPYCKSHNRNLGLSTSGGGICGLTGASRLRIHLPWYIFFSGTPTYIRSS